MLTGRLPFAADTPVALLVQRLQVQPMPPDRVRPDLNISLDVSKLVMEAIEKERENRYRSAGGRERAVAGGLEGGGAGRGGGGGEGGPSEGGGNRKPPRKPVRRSAIASARPAPSIRRVRRRFWAGGNY